MSSATLKDACGIEIVLQDREEKIEIYKECLGRKMFVQKAMGRIQEKSDTSRV